MSNRYKGAIISATPPTTTGGESGVASGAWTLEQQMQLIAAGLWPSQPLPKYIEDVFSTYLYTGTGATRTITNNIDLSTKGGLVWIKNRDTAGYSNLLIDTVRGAPNALVSNLADPQTSATYGLTAFTTSGFTLGTSGGNDIEYNGSNKTFASWTFRKQPKMFDIQTWTGSGANRTISHALGAVPGCIMVKRTDTTGDWQVYHRSLANTEYLVLNDTAAKATGATRWNSTTPTSTVFSLGTDATVNASGGTYVAYLFAHDAGGFGLTGTDNVISCGSFTTDGSTNATVTLGYEPQWVLVKNTSAAENWFLIDTMRGWNVAGSSRYLRANTSGAESGQALGFPTATGFTFSGFSASNTYIYIAIRRGPMKVPTTGTSVYNAIARTGTGANATVTGVGFASDWVIARNRTGDGSAVYDRLRGNTKELCTAETAAEYTITDGLTSFASMDGVSLGADATNGRINYSPYTYINWFFKRAPSFMDVVCYTGTGSATTFSHNLGAVPELMIVKSRSRSAENWPTYAAPVFVPGAGYTVGRLNDSIDFQLNNALFNNARPTASVFSVGTDTSVNFSGSTYVAYLFATCAGVSKVGSYTGTGTTKQIDCGFTAGARFVLIKRTDSTGDWYVYDSARGITSGNDPYLFLNSSAAEVTNTNYVDTDSTGFKVTAAAPAGLNASGGTYIFLAIA